MIDVIRLLADLIPKILKVVPETEDIKGYPTTCGTYSLITSDS